jgi:predicted Rdx family selenoprotein
MSKILEIEIKNCCQCPYLLRHGYVGFCQNHEGKGLTHINEIPSWCLLPDKKEAQMSEKKLREEVAKFIYEHHHPRMFDTWEELKDKYRGSAEINMNEADSILALIKEYVKGIDNPYDKINKFNYSYEEVNNRHERKGFNEAINHIINGVDK